MGLLKGRSTGTFLILSFPLVPIWNPTFCRGFSLPPSTPTPGPRVCSGSAGEGGVCDRSALAPAGAAPGPPANRVPFKFSAGAAWRGLRARSLRTCLERDLNARRHLSCPPSPRGWRWGLSSRLGAFKLDIWRGGAIGLSLTRSSRFPGFCSPLETQ